MTYTTNSPRPLLYALLKRNSAAKEAKSQTVNELLTHESPENLALYALFIAENTDLMDEVINRERHARMDQGIELNENTWKRFADIMGRIAHTHEGISRQERTFIQRFWRTLVLTERA